MDGLLRDIRATATRDNSLKIKAVREEDGRRQS